MTLINMLTHTHKNTYLYATLDAERRGILSIKNRLELHYALLKQGKEVLNDNGAIINCIGWRIDYKHIEKMYNDLGYTFEVLNIFPLKQFATETVLSGYVDTEHKYKNSFKFFDYTDDNINKFNNELEKNDTNIQKMFKESKIINEGYSALRALNNLIIGKEIGHIGVIIKATLK